MVGIKQYRELRFVSVCIFLQAHNALFDQPSESSADLKAFASFRGSIFDSHCELPHSSA